jgi:hypothetical protein
MPSVLREGWLTRAEVTLTPSLRIRRRAPWASIRGHHGMDPQAAPGGAGDAPDVVVVRRHDAVVATNCSFDHGNVDDVGVGRFASEHADVACLVLTQGLDAAHGQQPDEARLAGAASPGLGEGRRWHDRRHSFGEEPGVDGPHPAVVPLAGHQCASVVGDTGHLTQTAGSTALWGHGSGGPAQQPTRRRARPPRAAHARAPTPRSLDDRLPGAAGERLCRPARR